MPSPREYVRAKKQFIWTKMEDFPNYSINNLGKIRNDVTGRILKDKLKDGVYSVTLEAEPTVPHLPLSNGVSCK